MLFKEQASNELQACPAFLQAYAVFLQDQPVRQYFQAYPVILQAKPVLINRLSL